MALFPLLFALTLCPFMFYWPASEDANIPEQPVTPHIFQLQSDTGCENLECWDGIVPASTTFTDAKILLESQYGVENVTVVKYPKSEDKCLGKFGMHRQQVAS